jgi:hypothetical protein
MNSGMKEGMKWSKKDIKAERRRSRVKGFSGKTTMKVQRD